MLGAMIGDIAGSVYEWNNIKTKDFDFFHPQGRFTDDTVMTCAVASALLKANSDEKSMHKTLVAEMQRLGRLYPHAGYGGMFAKWLQSDDPQPYNSYGNGSAMRVSPVAWLADSLEEAKSLARISAEVSHNHPEGIKGAQAVAAAVYMARSHKNKDEIRNYIESNFYRLNFSLDQIRPNYRFDLSCQGSVPQAIVAFLEAEDFEDAVRNAISIGGDSDTIAAIAGSIAEAFYGIPEQLRLRARAYWDEGLLAIVAAWNEGLMGRS